MNRFYRRLERFRKLSPARRSQGRRAARQDLFAAKTPPDVTSVRAKSSRHGKSTADKWNQ